MSTNTIYLVRHGENPANLSKEFSYRKVDYSLTPKGRQQAQQTGEYFHEQRIDAIYSSPLKRAVETARLIGDVIGRPVIVLENFRELNVGELEDMGGSPEAWRRHYAVVGAWCAGQPEVAFPGGEDHFSLVQRMRQGVELALAERQGQRIIIVGHGGLFIYTIQDLCPGVDLETLRKQETHNCAISEVSMTRNNGRWHGELQRWADFSHLSGYATELVSGSPTPSSVSGGGPG